MIRTLFIIAGGAFVLCLACLGGAVALGGRDLSANDWTWVVGERQGDHENLHFERGKASPTVTRTVAWTGGQALTIDVPADVTYVQGDKPGVVISGPKGTVDRVRLVDGRLTLDDDDAPERGYIRVGHGNIRIWSETELLKITVTAPSVNSFHVEGSGDLRVEGYNQPTLGLLLDGSGDVEVAGRAGKLELRSNASGDADLESLDVNDANIDTTGSGEVRVGPTGAVEVALAGSGDVHLTRRAASVQKDITGSGELIGG